MREAWVDAARRASSGRPRRCSSTCARHRRRAARAPADDMSRAAVAQLACASTKRMAASAARPSFRRRRCCSTCWRWPPAATRARARCSRRRCDQMAAGGMYDHVGGGFARYSTDERWHVPHFEKMLYDNAQLARVYAGAFRLTGDERLRFVAEDIDVPAARNAPGRCAGGLRLRAGRRCRGRRGQVPRLDAGRVPRRARRRCTRPPRVCMG